MFYPKFRHASSNSTIDISSIQPSKTLVPNHSSHLLYNPSLSKSAYNQNRAYSHRQLCHAYSQDSLDQEFVQNTKQTFNKLFHQTNFNELLNQIQDTLQPIVKQLREQIQHKQSLSKQERLICMKSCAKFIVETLLNNPYTIDDHFTELYQLQQILNRILFKQQRQQNNISTQTDEHLEKDIMRLHISKDSSSAQKQRKSSKVSFVPVNEHSRTSTDDLLRQKHYHRSASRVFRKLNNDLQKLHNETPFKSHLSKYHKHNH